MKKDNNKLIKLLKTGILFLGISLLLWNCEKEEENQLIESNTSLKTVTKKESINFLNSNMNLAKGNSSYLTYDVSKITFENISNTDSKLAIIPAKLVDSDFYSRILLLNINNSIKSIVYNMYSYPNQETTNFSGEVTLNTLDGKLIKAFRFLDGVITNAYFPKEINYQYKNSLNDDAAECRLAYGCNHTSSDKDCICNNEFLNEIEIKSPPRRDSAAYISVSDLYGSGGPEDFNPYGCEVDCNGWDSGAGSGNGGIYDNDKCPIGFIKDVYTNECVEDKTLDDIVDNTNNTCVGDIIKKLQEKDRFKSLVPDLKGVSHLSQIVLDLFGKCKNYDLEIKIDELGRGPNGGLINAETKGIESITLDDDLVEDATKLSIAKTLIHESMHVFINFQINKRDLKSDFYKSLEEYYNKNSTGNLAQHQFMSQFVDALAYSISAFDSHRQDISYYTKLSWGGLEQSDAYKAFSGDKKKEIQTIIKNERDANSDAKSTKC